MLNLNLLSLLWQINMSRNKIKTPSYFIKRLRDNGFVVIKLFSVYGKGDPRRWTVMVNPSFDSVLITCYTNKESLDDVLFEFNDGDRRIQRNFSIKTDSIEVIIDFLLRHSISNNSNYPGRDRYLTKRLNTYDEKQKTIIG
jgi:hypothetical protein